MSKRKHIFSLAALALIMVFCAGCGKKPAASVPDPMGNDENSIHETLNKTGMKEIHAKHVSLWFPEEYSSYLVHQETEADGAMAEIFFMEIEETRTELFRIYFGDETTGTYLGTLQSNGEKIPVTVLPAVHAEDEFPDDESREIYYEMMDCLTNVLEHLQPSLEDSEGNIELALDSEPANLSYWEFSLPAGIEWEESTPENGYLAKFYGTIAGNRYELYSVAVGGNPLRTVIGSYTDGDDTKLVSVESADLPNTDAWTTEAEILLYTMMDSINDVIQTISESEGFSNTIPENQ